MSKQPFTDKEQEIVYMLVSAVNNFVDLHRTHPSEMQEFVAGIHMCQKVMEHRVLQRDYPDTFPVYLEE